MNEQIEINPNILAGKPVIAGTRIPVALIINLLAHGYSVDRIIKAYPVLTDQNIRAALEYAQARLDREEIYPVVKT